MLLERAWTWCQAVVRQTRGERGGSYMEYALLVALIAVICIAAVSLFGGTTNESFSSTGSALEVVATGS